MNDIATSLISEETTFKIFLIVLVVAQAYAIIHLFRSKEKRDDYIREQDKANLLMLSEVTNAVKEVATDTNESKKTISELRIQSEKLLGIIEVRLSNICNHGNS